MTVRTKRYMLAGSILLGAVFTAQGAVEGDTTTVNVTGTLLDAPECTINGNNQVDVDFGDDVVIGQIDGTSYKKKQLELRLVCNNLANNALMVTIDGPPAPFNDDLIKTDVEGLGIRLFIYSSSISPRGTSHPFYYGQPLYFSVAPVVQDGVTLSAQPFSGTGTIVFRYQ